MTGAPAEVVGAFSRDGIAFLIRADGRYHLVESSTGGGELRPVCTVFGPQVPLEWHGWEPYWLRPWVEQQIRQALDDAEPDPAASPHSQTA